jgi:N-acetylneuraminic acid mutarotase
MIVWGGADNTGGRYNPSTDSWTDTSTINAPEARGGYTTVWTGSEMIVWGGSNDDYFNTGGRYNPNTDSWLATSLSNAPSARRLHTAVWTGSEMIVWGGYFFDCCFEYIQYRRKIQSCHR